MDLVFHKHRAEPCVFSGLSLILKGSSLLKAGWGGLLASIRTWAWVGISSPSLPSREKKDFLNSSLP